MDTDYDSADAQSTTGQFGRRRGKRNLGSAIKNILHPKKPKNFCPRDHSVCPIQGTLEKEW